jgi:hypothetical protein
MLDETLEDDLLAAKRGKKFHTLPIWRHSKMNVDLNKSRALSRHS